MQVPTLSRRCRETAIVAAGFLLASIAGADVARAAV